MQKNCVLRFSDKEKHLTLVPPQNERRNRREEIVYGLAESINIGWISH